MSIIYANGKQDDQFIVPKISTNTTLPDRFFLNGFTTLKANSTVKAYGVGITRGASNTLNDVRKLIDKQTVDAYLDSELQIIHELYFSNAPQLKTLLEKSMNDHKNIPIALVVLHIYSELDPCGWCGAMLGAFSERVNKDKKIGEWYDDAHKDLKAKFDQELENLQGIWRTMEPKFDKSTKAKKLSELTKEVLQPDATAGKLSQDVVDKYLAQKEVVSTAANNLSMNARFMIITSSGQACHRSREIGLDPVFMDAELSKLPITVKFADIQLPRITQVTVIPQNFVIFTPDADVKDFPLTRIMAPSGVSMYSLLRNEEKDFEELRPQTHAQASKPSTVAELELKKSISTVAFSGTRIQGIQNVSNTTCYMNSTLQAMCASPLRALLRTHAKGTVGMNLTEIFNSITKGTQTATDISQNVWNIVCELYKHSPSEPLVEDLRGLLAEQPGKGLQQDANELLNMLIDKISEEEKDVAIATIEGLARPQPGEKQPFTKQEKADLKILFIRLLSGVEKIEIKEEDEEKVKLQNVRLKALHEEILDKYKNEKILKLLPITSSITGCTDSTLTCPTCPKSESTIAGTFTMLHLPIQNSDKLNLTTLDECLSEFSVEEKLSEENKWMCPKCKKPVLATKIITRSKLPQILVIQLERFYVTQKALKGESQEQFKFMKLSHKITYDENWTINYGGTGGRQSKTYRLKAVINHSDGEPSNSGHYTATVLGPDEKWYTANDSSVTETAFSASPDAYILLYEATS